MSNRLLYSTNLKGKANITVAFILSLLFIIISILMIENGGTLLWLIPPALIVVMLALIAIDKLLIFTVFLTPLSIQLRFIIPDTSIDIFLPTELMLAGILLLVFYKLIVGKEITRKILNHPVSIISFCILGWCLITSFSGTMPLVSLKSLIARLWFFAGFYILAIELFRKPGGIRNYFSAYIAGMVPVVLYYLVRMWEQGIFNQKMAYKNIRPFFNDHTSLGAALAFCIPVIVYFLTIKKISLMARIGLSCLLFVFLVAFLLSYSRAAWMSLFAAGLVALFLLFKISWKIVIPVILAGTVIIFISWSVIMMHFNENKQDSSDNIKSHLQSVSNIRSDVSNLERLNRWKCALRMFREKPILGWGPATYQFNYAPFQVASEKTMISTNWGEGGNAHSEYLGSLVDSGIPGMILYILLLFVSIRKGIIIWKTHSEKQMRYLSLVLVSGLTTYFVHGAFNNFLDTDKISALFWGMIAGIVAIDIGMEKPTVPKESSEIGSDN
jgi:putative inorganic carbon (hco3(-)) transporter